MNPCNVLFETGEGAGEEAGEDDEENDDDLFGDGDALYGGNEKVVDEVVKDVDGENAEIEGETEEDVEIEGETEEAVVVEEKTEEA